ncbi:SDR family NAD(P)-dependent oxidoreductase [Caulobacter mirabilis]|uniref:D-xylose 1-dehydrogenase n=1 Tax=Caulobacter mirabilis TaxID=69666 RepID=A0A2D2AZF5_9CAUL|nr:SDR family NAD(P)-dependent oxidoreductase [Caulobacter mirabilis]ATQ43374.1 short-chain dehydrogenase [Caulobacter mirabilis]
MGGSDLEGQIAVVTGGASGIGRAAVEALSAAGAGVVIADRDGDTAQALAAALQAEGRSAHAISLDIAKSTECDHLVADTLARFGRLDILIHSAGVGVERRFLETSDEDWERLISIDLSGSFYCMRAAGRAMSARGYGRIVVLSSTAGVAGGTGRAAYGAAKGGLIMLTKVLAVELAPTGVTVNALAPGAIETELVARMHSAETRTNYTRSIPMDRYGTPAEVAHAALFLASPRASYITGHVLAVDGGFLAAGVINREAATGAPPSPAPTRSTA